MSRNFPPEAHLEGFLDSDWISAILYRVRRGKEATVFACEGGAQSGGGLVAAKVYHAAEFRNFRNAAVYRSGRIILNERDRRAVTKKTRYGHEFESAVWTGQEYETLSLLHRAGADVPRPLTSSPEAILMTFVGDEEGPALPLHDVEIDTGEARRLCDRLLWNVEQFLAHDRIHGDLSEYNVLYGPAAGKVTVIDFPQSVDPRFNPHARTLLERDVAGVLRAFARYGVQGDADRITDRLWRRFMRAEL
ncbi:MAG: RIO1 family regulatory kinase/ATPase domain-containing protein [Dehalococcoidia bacterium]